MTEGNGEVRELPEGWIQLKLENVADWGSGGTPSRKRIDYFNGDIPWIKTGELRSKYIRNTEEKITKEAINKSSAKLFTKGSVAIAMYGATIGKTSILGVDASTNQACAVAKPLEKVLFNEFIYYYLSSQIRKFVELGKGGAQPNISQNIIKNYLIYLPPFNEQQRIVEKIEELFSDLEQGVESLKTAQKQLKIYRQVVLKWAFEGKLTEKWRSQIQQEKLDIKTGEELLAQIKAERENRYQHQSEEWGEAVREWEAIRKVGKKPAKPQKPRELPPLSEEAIAELPQLPKSWCWIQLEMICKNIVDCLHSTPKFKSEGLYCVDTTCIEQGKIMFEKVRHVDKSTFQERISRLKPEFSDILFAREGTIGTTLIVPQNVDLCLGQRMMHFRLFDYIEPKFFMYSLQFPIFIKQYKPLIGGTTSPHLNIKDIKNLILSIVSKEEQEQIVQEIESRLSICDQLEATIIENLQKAEALRQSILKQAFEGKLVPQDPNDEPAEKLLERIKQEKLKVKKGEQLIIQGL